MAKKTVVKRDFTKGVLSTTINKNVTNEIAHANTQRDVWRSYVDLCAHGHMQPENAKELLLAIRSRKLALRKENTDSRSIAVPTKQRVYEASVILRLSTMKCWPAIFNNMRNMDVSEGGRGVSKDTLFIVSKWLRSKELGWDKTIAEAPPRDKMLAAIEKASKVKAGSKTTVDRKSEKPATITDAAIAIATILRQAKGLSKWFDGEKGVAFAKDIAEAAAKMKPFAKLHTKNLAAAAAE